MQSRVYASTSYVWIERELLKFDLKQTFQKLFSILVVFEEPPCVIVYLNKCFRDTATYTDTDFALNFNEIIQLCIVVVVVFESFSSYEGFVGVIQYYSLHCE